MQGQHLNGFAPTAILVGGHQFNGVCTLRQTHESGFVDSLRQVMPPVIYLIDAVRKTDATGMYVLQSGELQLYVRSTGLDRNLLLAQTH